jgi:hypothetical protein
VRLFFSFLLLCCSICAYAADWEKVGSRGMMEFVVIAKEHEANEKAYLDIISNICMPGEFCHVMFWTDKKDVPSSWPMTEEQKDAMTVDYFYNANSDETIFLWNCRIVDDPEKCF